MGNAADTNTKTHPGTETKPETRTPSMFKVLLLNDDYTPMDFVVLVLTKFFRKSEVEATEIMLHVHHKGFGVAGIYPQEIAETKVFEVNSYSQKSQFPLKCIMEKE
ncbi:MAG TPA: ATP-dependent Clp protease adapter ClpS [Bdellovibrionales bacterium]|nr:ATP-dependent Clp protease adapter ClpS [Bdellovibrionales bacterium]